MEKDALPPSLFKVPSQTSLAAASLTYCCCFYGPFQNRPTEGCVSSTSNDFSSISPSSPFPVVMRADGKEGRIWTKKKSNAFWEEGLKRSASLQGFPTHTSLRFGSLVDAVAVVALAGVMAKFSWLFSPPSMLPAAKAVTSLLGVSSIRPRPPIEETPGGGPSGGPLVPKD